MKSEVCGHYWKNYYVLQPLIEQFRYHGRPSFKRIESNVITAYNHNQQ